MGGALHACNGRESQSLGVFLVSVIVAVITRQCIGNDPSGRRSQRA